MLARAILFKTVRVGVSREIEPAAGPAFAVLGGVARRVVDELLVSLGEVIFELLPDLSGNLPNLLHAKQRPPQQASAEGR